MPRLCVAKLLPQVHPNKGRVQTVQTPHAYAIGPTHSTDSGIFSLFHLQISIHSLLNEMALLVSQYWNNTHNIKNLKLVSKQGIWRCSALQNSCGDVPGIANISLWQHAAVRGESAATRRHEVCWDVPRAPWCSGGRLAEGQTHSFAPRCGGTSPDFCGAQVSFAYLCACHGYLCAAAERNGCVWSQYNLSIQ